MTELPLVPQGPLPGRHKGLLSIFPHLLSKLVHAAYRWLGILRLLLIEPRPWGSLCWEVPLVIGGPSQHPFLLSLPSLHTPTVTTTVSYYRTTKFKGKNSFDSNMRTQGSVSVSSRLESQQPRVLLLLWSNSLTVWSKKLHS